MGFVEVYNEEVRDLLHSASPPGYPLPLVLDPAQGQAQQSQQGRGGGGGISIREDSKGNIVLAGAREEGVRTLDEVMALLQRGSAIRTTGNTLMNEKSSRSHAIFTLIIEKALELAGGQTVRTRAKFHLVRENLWPLNIADFLCLPREEQPAPTNPNLDPIPSIRWTWRARRGPNGRARWARGSARAFVSTRVS